MITCVHTSESIPKWQHSCSKWLLACTGGRTWKLLFYSISLMLYGHQHFRTSLRVAASIFRAMHADHYIEVVQ